DAGHQQGAFSAYFLGRWEILGTTACGFVTALLLCGRVVLSKVLPDANTFSYIHLIDILDDMTRFLVVATTFFAMMRTLRFLTSVSLFFFIVQSALKTALREFSGVQLVAALAILGVAGANYLLAGGREAPFGTYGDSIFQTLSLLFGSPMLFSLPPVGAFYSLVLILVWWTILLPMLVALVVYAVRKVMSKTGLTETEMLGAEMATQARDFLAEFVFCCTPDPGRHGSSDEIRRLRQEAELAEIERQQKASEKRVEEARMASSDPDTKIFPSRVLLCLLLLFSVFFVAGISLLFDAPRVYRDHTATNQLESRRFLSTDPFASKSLLELTPPLDFRDDLCATTDSESSENGDAEPPAENNLKARGEGAQKLQNVLNALSEPLPRTLRLKEISSLQGIYDWLENVFAEEVLNAAYAAPGLAHRAPLANPGALLIVKRVSLQCRSTASPLYRVCPVTRRSVSAFSSLTSDAYGLNGARFTADPDERVYRVGLFFTPVLSGAAINASNPPSTSPADNARTTPNSASPSSPVSSSPVSSSPLPVSSSSTRSSVASAEAGAPSRRLSPGVSSVSPRRLGDPGDQGDGNGDTSSNVSSGVPSVSPPSTGRATAGVLSGLLGSPRVATLDLTAEEFAALYQGPSSMKGKVQSLKIGGFLDYQLATLDVVWIDFNGDSGVYLLNKVTFDLANTGSLTVMPAVVAVPSWTLSPTSASAHASFVLIVIGSLCFLLYLFYSYHTTQKRIYSSSLFIFLDFPTLIFLSLFVFFYISLLNVSFTPGWESVASIGLAVSQTQAATTRAFSSLTQLASRFLSGLNHRQLSGDFGVGLGDQGFGLGDQGFGLGDQGFGLGDQGFGLGDGGVEGSLGAAGRAHSVERGDGVLSTPTEEDGREGSDARGSSSSLVFSPSPLSSPSLSPSSSSPPPFSFSSSPPASSSWPAAPPPSSPSPVVSSSSLPRRLSGADESKEKAAGAVSSSSSSEGEFGDSLNIPGIVPGPVQPWLWVPGSSPGPQNSPPPTAESTVRFLRLQESLEAKSDALFRAKILAVLTLLMVAIRILTLVAAVPHTLRDARRLIEILYGAGSQIALASVFVIVAFFAFCFAGYTILGAQFRGFSTPTYSIVTCLMVLTSKWNFNAITAPATQQHSLTWQFEAFVFFFCIVFFCYLNYLVLAFIYLRYSQVKLETTVEVQELMSKYGVECRRRINIAVSGTVILYWKAFLKALQMAICQANAEGQMASLDSQAALLRDRFFDDFRGLPSIASLPCTTKERLERAFLGTQLVRIQQYITDLEFLKAKQFLILYDLKVLGDYQRSMHKLNKKKGLFIASLERGLQDLNEEIDVLQNDIALLTYADEQAGEGVEQRHRQRQLLDLTGVAKGPATSLPPGVYLAPETLAEAREVTREREAEREKRIEEWRRRVSEGEVSPMSLNQVRRRQREKQEFDSGSPFAVEVEGPSFLVDDASPETPPGVSTGRRPSRTRPLSVGLLAEEETSVRDPERCREARDSVFAVSPLDPTARRAPVKAQKREEDEEEEDEDWDLVRQQFGGEKQPTLHFQDDRGNDILVRPRVSPETAKAVWIRERGDEEPQAVVKIKKDLKIRALKNKREHRERLSPPAAVAAEEPDNSDESGRATGVEEEESEAGERPATNAPAIHYARSVSMMLAKSRDTAEDSGYATLDRRRGKAPESKKKKRRKPQRKEEEEQQYQVLETKKAKKKKARGGVFGVNILGEE
ncbi:polycystin cation channel protein, partial [Toxoplasma gondii CAST]